MGSDGYPYSTIVHKVHSR